MENQLYIALKNNKLFLQVDLSNLDLSQVKGDLKPLKEGEILYREEDPADQIYLVVSGEINLLKKKLLGSTKSFILSENDFFGYDEIAEQTARTSTAVALRDSYLISLSLEELNSLLIQNSNIKTNLLSYSDVQTGSSTSEFEEDIIDSREDETEPVDDSYEQKKADVTSFEQSLKDDLIDKHDTSIDEDTSPYEEELKDETFEKVHSDELPKDQVDKNLEETEQMPEEPLFPEDDEDEEFDESKEEEIEEVNTLDFDNESQLDEATLQALESQDDTLSESEPEPEDKIQPPSPDDLDKAFFDAIEDDELVIDEPELTEEKSIDNEISEVDDKESDEEDKSVAETPSPDLTDENITQEEIQEEIMDEQEEELESEEETERKDLSISEEADQAEIDEQKIEQNEVDVEIEKENVDEEVFDESDKLEQESVETEIPEMETSEDELSDEPISEEETVTEPEEESAKRSDRLETEELHKIIKSLQLVNSNIKVDEVLNNIVTVAADLTNADRGTLYLIDKEHNEVWSKVAMGGDIQEIRLKIGQGIAGWVAENGEIVNIEDVSEDERFNHEIDKLSGYETVSMLCFPIKDREDKIVGVLQLLNSENGKFDEKDENFLSAISIHCSLALQNAEMLEKLLMAERVSSLGKMTNFLIQDIKKPLLVSKRYAEHLKSKELSKDADQIVEMILDQLTQVSDLVRTTSSYAEGKAVLRTSRVSLNEILKDYSERLESFVQSKGSRIENKFDDDVKVQVDTKEFFQCYNHIIRNACDSMPDGGTIEVTTQLSKNEVAIFIEDDGMGIPESLIEKIFDPFMIHGKTGGTGLGLTITKEIIENHSGTIRVESILGEGSTFIITLPKASSL